MRIRSRIAALVEEKPVLNVLNVLSASVVSVPCQTECHIGSVHKALNPELKKMLQVMILSREQRGAELQCSGMLYIMAFSLTHGFDINVGRVTFKWSRLCLNSLASV